MNRSLIVILLFLTGSSWSQTLTVLDKTNLQPIENVAIANMSETRTSLTNKNGQAELAMFDPSDTIFFQHPSYQQLVAPIAVLQKLNFRVLLTRSTINLSEYVVSASKWEQKRDEVPNRITRLKSQEVAYLNPQTTADLIGNTNEVFIQKSQMAGGSPMIRGFSANSVLIVVDGVRMNNAIYRSGNLQNIISIDANTLDEAEIIFGPGSIIYGSDALGGVMDFHTRKVPFETEDPHRLNGQALMRFSTANLEKTAHADLSYARKNWGFFTSFTYSDFSDLRMGSRGNDEYQRLHYVETDGSADRMLSNSEPNLQKFTAYNQFNFTQKIALRLSEKASLDYGFHLSNTSNIPRYDRLIQYTEDGTLEYAEWFYGPQQWMLHTLSLNLSGESKLYDNARLTLAFQDVEESRHDRKYQSSDLRSRVEQVDVYSLNADLDKKLSNRSSLFYGIEAVYNTVESEAQSENTSTGEITAASTRYPDGGSDYATAAAYVNFKSNLHERVTLQTGVRYTYVYAHTKFDDTTFFPFPYSEITLNTGALNGSLGFVFRATSESRLNFNLSSGFRAPNIDDLAKVFDSEPGNVIVPNNNLEPEYTYNVDLGLIRNFGPRVYFEITGFYTFIANLMVRRDYQLNGADSIFYDGTLSQVQAIQNASEGWVAGLSANLRADLSERIGFFTSLNYMDGADDEGDAIRHVTPLFGSTGFTYAAKKLKIDIRADYNGQIKYEDMALSERNKPHLYATDSNGNPYAPSWLTLNIKGYYQINQVLQVNVGLDNIFDRRYRSYSSGLVAPGRNFMLALRANF